MTQDELQAWLLQDGVRQDLDALVRLTVATELDNLAPNAGAATDAAAHQGAAAESAIDWPRLLFAGSILARSQQREAQEAALRIATAALVLSPKITVKDAGGVLLSKLSNFRAVELASDRTLIATDLEARLGVGLRIEAQRREIERSVLIESSGAWLEVNEFQSEFWSQASTHDWLSASAPTASGKTFLVLQWLIEQITTTPARVAVYLAPTRALVSEIETNLAQLLKKSEKITVSSLPLREKYDTARSGGARVILVLTQERLHLLMNAFGDAFVADLLIVDEAHKIGDNQRGVILQDAIERAIRANPRLRAVFISPATQNPEELLTDAPSGTRAYSLDSDKPTVLQNVIMATQVPRHPKLWALNVRSQQTALPIGTLKLAHSPSTIKKKLAFIAAAAGQRGGTLVYANGAAESEAIADLIFQLQGVPSEIDPDLAALADLARKGVHPHFRLAPLVERGVAFHFGNMPSLLRLEIERLFKAGKIRFLVCTSTLIEGVNLSCRTIVLRGPRKGKGHPMEAHDFWNLAGRAGRWGNEFQGNIICIDPQNQTAWPTGVPERARYSIQRESDFVLKGKAQRLADYLVARRLASTAELVDTDEFEQVGAYLLTTFMREGSIAKANIAKRHDPSVISALDLALATLTPEIEIEVELASRHPGVSAVGLQRMLEAFRAYAHDPENLLPAPAASDDSYDRFVAIMDRINRDLFPAFSPAGAVRLYAVIIIQWLKGYSLAAMIRASIDWHRTNGRAYKLDALIRSTMELVETIARFKAPKFLSAYMDVLHLHLKQIGRGDLIDTSLDIGTQLEFGVSSRTLLSLMELGLSRMSAVALYEQIASDELSKDECLIWVKERQATLDAIGIPAIIVRELRDKLLGSDNGDTAREAT